MNMSVVYQCEVTSPEALRKEFIDDLERRLASVRRAAGDARGKQQVRLIAEINCLENIINFWRKVQIVEKKPDDKKHP